MTPPSPPHIQSQARIEVEIDHIGFLLEPLRNLPIVLRQLILEQLDYGRFSSLALPALLLQSDLGVGLSSCAACVAFVITTGINIEVKLCLVALRCLFLRDNLCIGHRHVRFAVPGARNRLRITKVELMTGELYLQLRLLPLNDLGFAHTRRAKPNFFIVVLGVSRSCGGLAWIFFKCWISWKGFELIIVPIPIQSGSGSATAGVGLGSKSSAVPPSPTAVSPEPATAVLSVDTVSASSLEGMSASAAPSSCPETVLVHISAALEIIECETCAVTGFKPDLRTLSDVHFDHFLLRKGELMPPDWLVFQLFFRQVTVDVDACDPDVLRTANTPQVLRPFAALFPSRGLPADLRLYRHMSHLP